MDLIVEMTEEVFTFQQDKDSEVIDPRFMNEWLQMFKSGVSITSASNEMAYIELIDYVYAKGQ